MIIEHGVLGVMQGDDGGEERSDISLADNSRLSGISRDGAS